MRLRYSAGYITDLLEAESYLRSVAPQLVAELARRLDASFSLLLDHPLMARTGRASGTRELVLKKFPYVVVYRATPQEIVILRLLHQAQDWP